MSIAVVIPCYRVRRHILGVLATIPPGIDRILVVDDACPERSGALVRDHHPPGRVLVLAHDRNRGVGAAVRTGYRHALSERHDIVVKMDGDGQMDPRHLPELLHPIQTGRADYAKGNRLFATPALAAMPKPRILGNTGFSLLVKALTGYWNVMDPTNGYTAIHRTALAALPLDRLADRYFFETDMLFRLAAIGAVVADIPMPARYGDEISNLRTADVLRQFPLRTLARAAERLATAARRPRAHATPRTPLQRREP